MTWPEPDPVGAADRPRVAIAHDYLTQRGGAERVVLALARAFPDAPVYTTLYDPDSTYPEFRDIDVRTSWLNRVAPLRRHHRAALPALPLAASSIRIDADVVIASSSGWAHGFRTRGRKLVYCYSPARWLYESERYLGDTPSRSTVAGLRAMGPALRLWDRRAAASVDQYLAISTVTQDRLKRTYGIEAPVVPAPHSVDVGSRGGDEPMLGSTLPADYFLVVSRLLPYKNVQEILAAFADRPHLNLVVVGAGPQKDELRHLATPNVTLLEGLSDSEMDLVYRRCTALVAASHEDFGLTPIEAAAYGKPSVVLRWGGFLDTVVEGRTGVFFDRPEPLLIASAVDETLARPWDPAVLAARAAEFSESRFAATVTNYVLGLWRPRPTHSGPAA
ncbi:glycosyltransferase [Nocardioides plantarum]|uniref:Glycosyltransferase n=1 Tax=Nocardioides plantarum TaxID=29299 RepID=A0ABV5K6G8_9ACTN|nr:glycosyltransferase [Nocardioides plantarum]